MLSRHECRNGGYPDFPRPSLRKVWFVESKETNKNLCEALGHMSCRIRFSGLLRKVLRSAVVLTALCTLRDRDGNWNVPYAHWNGSEFNRNANWLSNDWNSNYRVVLLVIRIGFRDLQACSASFASSRRASCQSLRVSARVKEKPSLRRLLIPIAHTA